MRKTKGSVRSLAEREIISGISRILGERLDDDCAYIKLGNIYLALTVDSISETSHIPKGATPEDIGWYAAAISLSDLASSGADPDILLLSIVAPRKKRTLITRIVKGANDCARAHSARIVGGDTKEGTYLVLTSVGVGRTPRPVTRSGARPGDSIYLTGEIGKCAAGYYDMNRARGAKKVLRISPRCALAGYVREHASACIDLSDGLVTSLYHLADASNCGMRVGLPKAPIDEDLACVAKCVGPDERLRVAANFGGDYELLFTSSDRIASSVGDVRVTKIGRVVSGAGVVNEKGRAIPDEGYEHFSDRWIGTRVKGRSRR
jgi:thiamine-monophosphate kinase